MIVGRSPIEHVDVPEHLPSGRVRDYYSGAIVAHQSGQTLAGLFLLRTFIEQWVKSLGAPHEYADKAIEWYMDTLPHFFKAAFPSLRDLYGELSIAIHAANASAELFDGTKRKIDKHFDGRRVHEIALPPKAAEKSAQ